MNKIILPAILAIALISSCKKDDQKLVDDLSGKWMIISAEEGHGDHTHAMDLEEAHELLFESITFNDCKIKNDDCAGSMEFHEGDDLAFTYTVNEDATQVTITAEGENTVLEVLESGDNTKKFSTEIMEDGEEVDVEFVVEKQ